MSRFILAVLVIPFLLGIPGVVCADEEPGIGQCVRECAWENHHNFPDKKELFKVCKRLCREEEPVITFEKTFGGEGWDAGYEVQETSDGGFVIVGKSNPFGGGYWEDDVYLIKTDERGEEVWSKFFGVEERSAGASVEETSDGGLIIAGTRNVGEVGDFNHDVYLIKTDLDGNEIWSKTLNVSVDDFPHMIRETSDGGFVVTGRTGDVPFALKTNATGDELWSWVNMAGTCSGNGMAAEETSDGGLMFAGHSCSFSDGPDWYDTFLVKTDSAGNPLWIRRFGDDSENVVGSAKETADGGFIIAGSTYSHSTFSDVWLVRTDRDGNEIWSKTYGGSHDDLGHAVDETSDGGFIIAGITRSYGAGQSDIYLIRTDKDGNEVWSRTFGGADEEWAHSVQETSDGGFIITGTQRLPGQNSRIDVYLIKTDADGNVLY